MRRGWVAQPQAIDDLTGFKVNYKDLKRQWDGNYSVDPDKRNPQDFLRARADNPKLDHPRPEATDTFFADNIIAEGGCLPIICEDGTALMAEGVLNTSLTSPLAPWVVNGGFWADSSPWVDSENWID